MADANFIITTSGAAFSLLFYENVRNPGDQMGFLLGETLEFVVKSHTDTDYEIETVRIRNNIETVVTCPSPEMIHDSVGRINRNKLKDFLRDKRKQVIGWFRFRRDTELVLTMRDKILHKEFASYFANGNLSKQESFVTCLLSSSTSKEMGTHRFRHIFFQHKENAFKRVPLRINNLEYNFSPLGGSNYKPTPTKKSSDMPDSFTEIIKSLNLDLANTSNLECAIAIQKAAERHLNQLIPEVCKSDHEVAELEEQVRKFKLLKWTKMNGNANNMDHEGKTSRISEEQKKLEKVSPLREESSDDSCWEWPLKNHSNITSPTITATHKPKNMETHSETSIYQNKVRQPINRSTEQPIQKTPPVNSTSETNVHIKNTVANIIRRSNVASEIVGVPIGKSEIGVGRGRGRLISQSMATKKAKNTSGTISTL